jgi:hypothetical protein
VAADFMVEQWDMQEEEAGMGAGVIVKPEHFP